MQFMPLSEHALPRIIIAFARLLNTAIWMLLIPKIVIDRLICYIALLLITVYAY